MCALQIDASEVCFRKIHPAEIRFRAGFSARFHPDFVLIQNLGQVDQRNSDRAFPRRNIFGRMISARNFSLHVFDFQCHSNVFPRPFGFQL